MKKLVFIILLLCVLKAESQDRISVMTYNVLHYGNITSYCTTSNNNLSDKHQYLKEIIGHYQPDIVGFNELAANSYLHSILLDTVLNKAGSTIYNKTQYSNAAGGNITNSLYYNSAKFELKSQAVLNSLMRDIILYQLYYLDPNLSQTKDTAFLYVVIAHLKAGSTTADQQTRAQMVDNMMQNLAQNYPVGDFLFMGDFNLKTSSEAAWQSMTNSSYSAYNFVDPINTPGSWNNSSTYADIHTQSTHASSNGCASSGGMDDRFDIIMSSQSVINGDFHYQYIPSSYKTPGNDGNRFNSSINSTSNNSAPQNIINALYELSDHLPVILELFVNQSGAGIDVAENFEILKFENPVANSLNFELNSIKSDNLNINIYSADSKLMKSENIKTSAGINQFEINIASLARGFYILRIDNGSHAISKKLIISN